MPKQIAGALRQFGTWSEHKSSNGRVYYYNYQTKLNQWQKPADWNDAAARMVKPSKDKSDRDHKRSSKSSAASNADTTLSKASSSSSRSKIDQKNANTLAQLSNAERFRLESDGGKRGSSSSRHSHKESHHSDRDHHRRERSSSSHRRSGGEFVAPPPKKPALDKSLGGDNRRDRHAAASPARPSMERGSARDSYRTGSKREYYSKQESGDSRGGGSRRGMQHGMSHQVQQQQIAIQPIPVEPSRPRRETLARQAKKELVELVNLHKTQTPEQQRLREDLARLRIKFNERALKDIDNYPINSMQLVQTILVNDRHSYKIGSLFNSHILPTLLKARSRARLHEIRSFRQQLRSGAISEQIQILQATLNDPPSISPAPPLSMND